MQIQYYSILGQVYGAGAYDSSTYEGGNATSGSSSGSTGGTLSNTGIAVISIVTIAAIILLVAILVRIWKRPRQVALAPVEVDDTADETDADPQDNVSR